MSKQISGALHFEAHPKSVKRALKSVTPDWLDVDVHRSDKARGEHGKTTVTYQHVLDATTHDLVVQALGKQAAIEEDILLRDDDDDEENA